MPLFTVPVDDSLVDPPDALLVLALGPQTFEVSLREYNHCHAVDGKFCSVEALGRGLFQVRDTASGQLVGRKKKAFTDYSFTAHEADRIGKLWTAYLKKHPLASFYTSKSTMKPGREFKRLLKRMFHTVGG